MRDLLAIAKFLFLKMKTSQTLPITNDFHIILDSLNLQHSHLAHPFIQLFSSFNTLQSPLQLDNLNTFAAVAKVTVKLTLRCFVAINK